MKKILIVFLFAAAAFGQTKSIVPRATHQGYLGTTSKSWLGANIDTIHAAIIFGAADYNTLTNKPTIPGQYDSASVAGAVAWGSVTGKPIIPAAYDSASVAGAVAWTSVTGKPGIPAAYDSASAAGAVAWGSVTGKPTVPAAYDSASVAANTWKFYGLDSTTYKAHVLAGKAASATVSDSSSGGAARAVTTIQYQGLDSATYKAHVLLGNAASATSSTQFSTLDSTTYKAHVLLGTAANATTFKTLDTTAFCRTARSVRIIIDTTKVVAATRTPIYLSGVLATDRAWVVFSDSTSGVRKRSCSGVCKANTLVVFTDTTVATVNALIYR